MRKINIIKPLFESHTVLDESIVKLASSYNLYLVGDTAIDMLCHYYGINSNYHHNNNIDFLSFDINLEQIQNYIDKLTYYYNFEKDIYEDCIITMSNNHGTSVSIAINDDQNDIRYSMTINNILVMSPSYMLYNKLDRYLNSTNTERKNIDTTCIEILLKIMDKIGETEFSNLEIMISDNLNSSKMIEIVNNLIDKLS